jgi:Tfp pilus assembly protein PilF
MLRLSTLAFAFLALAGCERKARAPSPSIDPLKTIRWDDGAIDWTKPVPSTPEGGLAEAGYAGTAACRPCHKQIYDRYARHSMASTGIRPLASLDARWLARIFDAGGETVQPSSGLRYRPLRVGDGYFIEELIPGPDGKPVHSWRQPVTHALSAGSYGMAFYFKRGERYYQFPIDYYAKLARWDLDPGFSQGNKRFGHPLDAFCISCHSDYPKRSAGSDQVFIGAIPVGVGCERCHGPGAKHLASLRREDIVNPKNLSPVRQLEVCTQCHLQERSLQRAGRHPFDYRPGESLDTVRVNFLGETPEPDRFYLLAHSERMVRSACWLRSGKKMTCTSCHDPHVSSADEPAAFWDEKCQSCHRDKRCAAPPEAQAREQGHCFHCHMRSGPTSMLPLVSVTDHFIQRRPPPVKPGPEEKTGKLVSWSSFLGEPIAGADVTALKAMALVGEGHGDEALPLALEALPSQPAVGRLYQWLVGRFDQRHDGAGALHALTADLRVEPNAAAALAEYARRQYDAGQVAEALHALDRAIALDAGDPEALETKGMFLFRAGRTDEARPLFERAAAESAMSGAAEVGLAALALKAGNRPEAIAHLEAAQKAAPGDPWVLDRLTASYAAAGNHSHDDELAGARRAFAARPAFASRWLPPSWR